MVTNTGNVTLKFGALSDTLCGSVSPSGATELAVGKSESFTCTHTLGSVGSYTNEASIEGNEGTGTKTSNKVVAKVPSEPSYTVEKLQRLQGESSYGAGELNGKSGQTVEYKIVVKNTGNVTLKFAAVKDSGCEGITPSGATEVEAGKEESFTCSHVLGVGSANNEVSVEGNEGTGTKTSNKVVAKAPAEPAFTIAKTQRIEGESSYTSGEVSGKLGQKAEYKVTVKNTGNVTLKFAALKDSACESISPSGATELAVGKEESFTCVHTLAVGSYTNEASIEGNEGSGTKTSNKVVAKVAAEPSYIIEKQQRIAGEGTYTSAEHTGKLGQVVEYKIIVRNTGNVPLKFTAIKDTGCEGISPTGATEVTVAGKEEFFTCTHTLTSVGSYDNEASIEGNEGTGTKTSNKVVAKVPAEPSFAIEKQQKIAGESSYTSGELTGKLGQAVEYKITVKNTGNLALKFTALKDSGCEGISPSGTTELAVGKEESFTCTHTLTAVGSYTNEASIEGNEGAGTKTSNKVVAKVPSEPSLHDRKAPEDRRRKQLRDRRKDRQTRTDRRIQDRRQEHRQPEAQIQRPQRQRLRRRLPVGHDRSRGRCRRVLHLHPRAGRGVLHQRSLDRRQRRHRHQDLQQSRRQSRRRTVLHDRKAAEDRRRKQLHLGRTLRQTRPDRRIQDHRQEHRQPGAQIHGPDGLRLRRRDPVRRDRLAAGKEESFTCTHKLAAVGSYSNEASIEGNEGTGKQTSDKVTTKALAEPSYTIEKLQKISGESSYATAEKTGKLGQTVEYKIVVKNTGNVPLKFAALKDSGCSGISPSSATELAAGAEESSTCTHRSPRSAPTPTKPRSKATKAPAPRPPTKSSPKSPPNPPSRSKSSRRSKAPSAAAKSAANSDRRSNTRSSSRTRATSRSNSAPSKTAAAKASRRPARPNSPPAPKRLHLHPQTLRGRLLHQRSLDRRQRRHRHQDLQQSRRQSRRRTLLHD